MSVENVDIQLAKSLIDHVLVSDLQKESAPCKSIKKGKTHKSSKDVKEESTNESEDASKDVKEESKNESEDTSKDVSNVSEEPATVIENVEDVQDSKIVFPFGFMPLLTLALEMELKGKVLDKETNAFVTHLRDGFAQVLPPCVSAVKRMFHPNFIRKQSTGIKTLLKMFSHESDKPIFHNKIREELYEYSHKEATLYELTKQMWLIVIKMIKIAETSARTNFDLSVEDVEELNGFITSSLEPLKNILHDLGTNIFQVIEGAKNAGNAEKYEKFVNKSNEKFASSKPIAKKAGVPSEFTANFAKFAPKKADHKTANADATKKAPSTFMKIQEEQARTISADDSIDLSSIKPKKLFGKAKKVHLSQLEEIVPTPEVSQVAPTPEVSQVVPTPEVSQVVPTPEVSQVVHTQEVSQVVHTPEVSQVVPTPEVSQVVHTPEVSQVVPTPEVSQAVHSLVAPSFEANIFATDTKMFQDMVNQCHVLQQEGLAMQQRYHALQQEALLMQQKLLASQQENYTLRQCIPQLNQFPQAQGQIQAYLQNGANMYSPQNMY